MEHRRKNWILGSTIGGLLAGCALLLYVMAIVLGDLNQDEGWYLYAARLVHEGRHPFLDFASTQGPVMAYVYSLAYPLTKALGVAGGRIFTAFCGGLTILLAMLLAARLATSGEDRRAVVPAALLTGGLLGLNLYHVYFTTLVKTYGLAGLLTMLGFLGLERVLRVSKQGTHLPWARSFGYSAAAAGCFALAAGTRLSAGALLPGVWLPLAAIWLRGGANRKNLSPVLTGMLAGGTATLAIVYLPFIWLAPAAVSFGLLEYHAGRQVGSIPVLLAYKAGFLLRLSASYFPALVLGTIGLGWWMRRKENIAAPTPMPLPFVMACGIAAVTVVHLAAPFPYDDYQVFVMPCLALLAAVPAAMLLARLRIDHGHQYALVAAALALMLLHSASSPLLQSWVTAGRDRIWWPLRTETPLQALRRAATEVRSVASKIDGANNGPLLLTQDTYLAVEADMRVPEGMELGPFCFFPGLDDAKALRYRVLNEALLTALIEKGTAEVAALSGYGLAIRAPEIVPVDVDMVRRLEEALLSRYTPARQIENFGQGETTLRILKRRTD